MAEALYGGLVLCILVVVIGAYFAGKKLSQVTFEAKGHEEIEKHLIRQVSQIHEIQNRYNRIRSELGADLLREESSDSTTLPQTATTTDSSDPSGESETRGAKW